MNEDMISIAIPTYNRGKVIEKVLKSVLNQTYQNLEIIVVDNASTDKTVDIVKKYQKIDNRIKLFINKKNYGPMYNWEKAIEKCSANYVKLLFSDDYLSKTSIEKTLKILKRRNDIAFVNNAVIIKDINGNVISKNNYFEKEGQYSSKKYIERILLGGNVSVSASHAFFRKKDLEKSIFLNVKNKINSDFSQHAIGTDALMFLNVLKNYDSFYYLDEYLTTFIASENSITITSKKEDLILLHLLGRAYFVENNIKDNNLIKRFNAHLFYNILRYSKRSNLGLNKLEDFYNSDFNTDIDYYFLLKKITKVILRKFIRFFSIK